jgi:DNA (cytosine-5)-methyltransferase 1
MINMINGISLFANVGIGETYFKEHNINICVANELLEKRAKFYSHLYPNCEMIIGDILHPPILLKLLELYEKYNCNFLIASPPCQGMSNAGKRDKTDVRNMLIIPTIDFIKKTLPANIIIENVPNMLKYTININGEIVKIVDYVLNELEPLDYYVNYGVLNAMYYDTPQSRERAIFLISKYDKWDFPIKGDVITLEDVIGDLPSLESGEKSDIKYHRVRKYPDRHVLCMKHTATGKCSHDNEFYYPRKKDGTRVKSFHDSYSRLYWDKPAYTVHTHNNTIGSARTVHPGRKLSDGTYSDARTLSLLELFRVTGLPDDWNVPDWASDSFVKQVIGEQFPPCFAAKLLETMPLN